MPAKTKSEKTEEKLSERAKAENIEEIVIDLAKKGNTPAQIGNILREKYGIYNIKALGTKVTKILKKHQITYKNDVQIISNKIKNMESHYDKNRQDKRAEREIVRYIALRKKLESYTIKKSN